MDVQQVNAAGWGLWPEQNAADLNDNIVVVPVIKQQGELFLELNDLIQPQNNDLDLNAPLEDDLGGIEELLDIVADLEQPVLGPHPEDVIDKGVPSDTSSLALMKRWKISLLIKWKSLSPWSRLTLMRYSLMN